MSSVAIDGGRRALVRSMTPAARAMRRALNSWCARVDERRQLLHATAALRHREVFVALNTWRSYARERRSRSAKIGGVLDTLSPQGRAMRRAFNSWAPLVSERASLRRGAMAEATAAPATPVPHLPRLLLTEPLAILPPKKSPS